MKKIIHIEGMSCGHCTNSVEKALKAVDSVTEVNVDLTAKTATVATSASVADDTLAATVNGLGFQVTSIA